MTLIDKVKVVVRNATHTSGPDIAELLPGGVLDLLEQIEPARLGRTRLDWADPDRQRNYLEYAAFRFRAEAPSLNEERLRTLLRTTVLWAMSGKRPVSDELSPLESIAASDVVDRFESGAPIELRYAVELGLVRQGTATSTGQTLLKLFGRDATLWLLALEIEQSTGPRDPWRLSLGSARHLRDAGQRVLLPEEQHLLATPNQTALQRLHALGTLTLLEQQVEGHLLSGWMMHEEGRAVLTDLLREPPRPLVLMARGQTRGDGTTSREGGNDDLHFAELVAHQLRNDLLPLRSDLESLGDLGLEAEGARLQQRALKALRQLESFAEDVGQIHDLQDPPTTFDLRVALAEAISATRHDRNGRTEVQGHIRDAFVRGPRQRFIEAIVELIRNATTNGCTTVVIEVGVEDRVEIDVFDDGGGIREDLVETIFNRGVSGRGSTGQGLALVRRVVERQMSGTIELVDPAHAGFRLRFPRFSGEE